MYFRNSLLAFSAIGLLSACGSDDKKEEQPITVITPPPVSIEYDHQVSGSVLSSGAVVGANVCVDLNMDKSCDDDEPQGTADNVGFYQIDWKSETESPDYFLIASWNSAATSVSVPQPLQVQVNDIFAQSKDNVLSSATSNKSNQLFALSEHSGEINALTDIEFNRYQLMLAANKTESEIQQLKERLAVMLKALYGISAEDIYQLSASDTLSDIFTSTLAIQKYISALVSELVSDPLVVEEVMSASIEQFRALVEQSNLSVEAYLVLEPLEVSYLINDTLIAQGYIEQPISESLLSQADWEVVLDGLGFKDTPDEPNPEDNFTLAPSHLYSSFTLSYGDSNESMIGAIINDPTGAGEPKPFALISNHDDENVIPQECWNTDVELWINTDRANSGYEPRLPEIVGNEIRTYYDGTEVPIILKLEKIDTASEVWSSILSAAPAQYKLDDIEWPNKVYRYFTSQQDAVLCRDEDYITHAMIANSVNSLSSSNIAQSLYPNFYPEDVTVDEVNKRFTVDGFGTYQWNLHEAPNDKPHLRIIQLESDQAEELISAFDPSDYLIVDAEFVEVSIYDAWDYDAFNDHLFITFDGNADNFNEKIRTHFMQFSSPLLP